MVRNSKLRVGQWVTYEDEKGIQVMGKITELGVIDNEKDFSTFTRLDLKDGAELVVYNLEQEKLANISPQPTKDQVK